MVFDRHFVLVFHFVQLYNDGSCVTLVFEEIRISSGSTDDDDGDCSSDKWFVAEMVISAILTT